MPLALDDLGVPQLKVHYRCPKWTLCVLALRLWRRTYRQTVVPFAYDRLGDELYHHDLLDWIYHRILINGDLLQYSRDLRAGPVVCH